MPDNASEFVSVRYVVDDVDKGVDFYTSHLGFSVRNDFAPAVAEVTKGDLRLLLSGPASSAGRAMPDGAIPGPGGWNRIHLIVDDLAAEVDRLRAEGVVSATTSSAVQAVSRSCCEIRRATWWSFSSPDDASRRFRAVLNV